MSRAVAGLEARDTPVWEQSCEHPQFSAPAVPGRVDVAVIGGGLTGLSAALHLVRARPGWTVVVLEAGRVGAGASGRSTGIVGPGVGTGITSLTSRFGPRVSRRMFRYSQDAVDAVVKLVNDEQIACDLTPSAHLLCASTQGQASRLGREWQTFTKLGLPTPLLGRDDLASLLGHDRYLSALEYQPVMLVNPLKLTLGLATAAARAGVQILEHSPVTGLQADPGAVQLRVGDRSALQAAMVVVATDGYTPPDLPYGRRTFAVRTHVLATEPLSSGQRAALGWSGREAVIDQRTFFSYYRFDAEGRLLFGGGPVCVPQAGPQASVAVWERLERELRQLMPALGQVRITHRWSGLTSAALDELPVVGAVPRQPGVYYAGAWRGHGLALSVANGSWLANRLAHGSDDFTLPWHRSRTGSPALGPLRSVGVRAYVRTFRTLDRGGALAERMRPARPATGHRGTGHPAGSRPV